MTRDEQLLSQLTDGEAGTVELAERAGLPARTVQRGLHRLIRTGYVVSPERGAYRLTALGRVVAADSEGRVVTAGAEAAQVGGTRHEVTRNGPEPAADPGPTAAPRLFADAPPAERAGPGAAGLVGLAVVVLLLIILARVPVGPNGGGGRYPPGTRFVG